MRLLDKGVLGGRPLDRLDLVDIFWSVLVMNLNLGVFQTESRQCYGSLWPPFALDTVILHLMSNNIRKPPFHEWSRDHVNISNAQIQVASSLLRKISLLSMSPNPI